VGTSCREGWGEALPGWGGGSSVGGPPVIALRAGRSAPGASRVDWLRSQLIGTDRLPSWKTGGNPERFTLR